ncbi:MAG: hypothetical protein O9264_17060 [Leptospira sp.]|jgi:hypothetical protein|nr:hypothetical protein [Leptospira sp.]
MRILVSLFLSFSLLQCIQSSQSYEQCDRADLDYLTCSLVIYQSYNLCAERANALSGSAAEKGAAKFQCDSERLVGLFYCDEQKKKACGLKK